jgi:hypothetical protein
MCAVIGAVGRVCGASLGPCRSRRAAEDEHGSRCREDKLAQRDGRDCGACGRSQPRGGRDDRRSDFHGVSFTVRATLSATAWRRMEYRRTRRFNLLQRYVTRFHGMGSPPGAAERDVPARRDISRHQKLQARNSRWLALLQGRSFYRRRRNGSACQSMYGSWHWCLLVIGSCAGGRPARMSSHPSVTNLCSRLSTRLSGEDRPGSVFVSNRASYLFGGSLEKKLPRDAPIHS